MTAADPACAARPGRASSDVPLLAMLAATTFLLWVSASAVLPLLPIYVKGRGGSDAMVGAVMASYFVAQVAVSYPLGRAADRFRGRGVLLGGLVVYAAASAAFLLPVPLAAFVAFRAIQGAGTAAAQVAALAVVGRKVRTERRGRAFGLLSGAQLGGMATGPLAGSLIGAASMRSLFLAAAVVGLAAVGPVWAARERWAAPGAWRPERAGLAGGGLPGGASPAGRPGGGRAAGASPAARAGSVRRAVVGAGIAFAGAGLLSGTYDVCWTLLLRSRGATTFEIGLSWTLFALPYLVVSVPAGWLADHLDRKRLAAGGLAVAALFAALYPYLSSVALLVSLGAVEAMAWAVAYPAPMSLMTEAVGPARAGRYQGTLASAQAGATAVTAAVSGVLFGIGRPLPFIVTAGVVLAGAAALGPVWAGLPGKAAGRR
ncbi:MAG: MFS transporter [Acidimicrobiales bacterium]